MAKPANFPGRKLERRLRALSRLEASWGWQNAPAMNAKLVAQIGAQAAREHRTLEHYTLFARTRIGAERARAIRTKKDRSARAKFRAA